MYDSLVPANEEKLYYHTHNGMVRAFSNWNTIFRIIDIISNEVDKRTIDIDKNNHSDVDKCEFTYTVGDMEYIVRVDIHKVRTAVFLLRKAKEEASV